VSPFDVDDVEGELEVEVEVEVNSVC